MRRETAKGEVEWQVVLARVSDGPLPRTHTDKCGAIAESCWNSAPKQWEELELAALMVQWSTPVVEAR